MTWRRHGTGSQSLQRAPFLLSMSQVRCGLPGYRAMFHFSCAVTCLQMLSRVITGIAPVLEPQGVCRHQVLL
jgi:hypothetical protein